MMPRRPGGEVPKKKEKRTILPRINALVVTEKMTDGQKKIVNNYNLMLERLIELGEMEK